MRRKPSPRTGEAKPRQEDDPRSPLMKVLERIAFGRRDKEMCAKWQEAIAGLTDREVVTSIYSDLKRAAAMLGDTVEAARIEKWARRAALLLHHADATEARAEAARKAEWAAWQEAAAKRRAEAEAAPAVAEPDCEPGSRPSHAAGCGPP